MAAPTIRTGPVIGLVTADTANILIETDVACTAVALLTSIVARITNIVTVPSNNNNNDLAQTQLTPQLFTLRQQAIMKAGIPHVFHFEGLPSDHQMEVSFFLLPLTTAPIPDRSVDDHVTIPKHLSEGIPDAAADGTTPPTRAAATTGITTGTQSAQGGTLPATAPIATTTTAPQSSDVGTAASEIISHGEHEVATKRPKQATKDLTKVEHNATDPAVKPPDLSHAPSIARFGVLPPATNRDADLAHPLPIADAPAVLAGGQHVRTVSLGSGSPLLALPIATMAANEQLPQSEVKSSTLTSMSGTTTSTTSETTMKGGHDSKSPVAGDHPNVLGNSSRGMTGLTGLNGVAAAGYALPPAAPMATGANATADTAYMLPDRRKAFLHTLPRDDILEARGMHIGVVSCNQYAVHKANVAGAIDMWQVLLNEHRRQPYDVILHIGDQVYADSDVLKETTYLTAHKLLMEKACEDPERFEELKDTILDLYRMEYRRTWNIPAQQELMACVSNLTIWDDHDIRDNFGDLKEDRMPYSLERFIALCARQVYYEFQRQLRDHTILQRSPLPHPFVSHNLLERASKAATLHQQQSTINSAAITMTTITPGANIGATSSAYPPMAIQPSQQPDNVAFTNSTNATNPLSSTPPQFGRTVTSATDLPVGMTINKRAPDNNLIGATSEAVIAPPAPMPAVPLPTTGLPSAPMNMMSPQQQHGGGVTFVDAPLAPLPPISQSLSSQTSFSVGSSTTSSMPAPAPMMNPSVVNPAALGPMPMEGDHKRTDSGSMVPAGVSTTSSAPVVGGHPGAITGEPSQEQKERALAIRNCQWVAPEMEQMILASGGDHYIQTYGSTGIVMLDLRGGFTFYSAPYDSPMQQMTSHMSQERLGSMQWEWLTNAMREDGPYSFVKTWIVVSTIPIIVYPTRETNGVAPWQPDLYGHWAATKYTQERLDMLRMYRNWQLRAPADRSLVFLGGDIHMGGVTRLYDKGKLFSVQLTTSPICNTTEKGLRGLIQAGPLTKHTRIKDSHKVVTEFSYTQHSYTQKRNFGVVDVRPLESADNRAWTNLRSETGYVVDRPEGNWHRPFRWMTNCFEPMNYMHCCAKDIGAVDTGVRRQKKIKRGQKVLNK